MTRARSLSSEEVPRPVLGLGQLGHCLGPPLLEKAPNLGANLFIYFLYINIFLRDIKIF